MYLLCCLEAYACVCVLLRSYKKREESVIAAVCVSFNYFPKHLNETSKICVCIWRYGEVSFLVYLISVKNELGS